jgi:hypothetical protein
MFNVKPGAAPDILERLRKMMLEELIHAVRGGAGFDIRFSPTSDRMKELMKKFKALFVSPRGIYVEFSTATTQYWSDRNPSAAARISLPAVRAALVLYGNVVHIRPDMVNYKMHETNQ